MKRFFKELLLLFQQLSAFYLYPPFSASAGPMGMVFLILLATLILSVLTGVLSGEKLKFLFPPVISLLFIPSVFLYYNESALIHALWYFVVSSAGLLAGSLARRLFLNRR